MKSLGGKHVGQQFSTDFERILCKQSMSSPSFPFLMSFSKCISWVDNIKLTACPSLSEVMSLRRKWKSPASDGLIAEFLQPSWRIIKNEVYDTICNFFFSKQFPKQFKHTIPLPIPKFKGAIKTSDFRPIKSLFYFL